MKILQVCGTFPPAFAYGGPPRSVSNLTSALSKRGHEVTIYTTDAYDANERYRDQEYQSDPSIDVYRFRNISNRLAWKNIQLPLQMLPALLRNVKHFDIVHSHEYRAPPVAFAYLASQLWKVPHINQPRGTIPKHDLESLKDLFDSLVGRRAINSMNKLLASSQVESESFTQVFPQIPEAKISHIPNGVCREEFGEIPEPRLFRKKYDIQSNTNVILYLGRIHHRKGGELLIESVSKIPERDIELVFVGPDEGSRDNWENLSREKGIHDRTTFTGPLYGEEKLQAYVDADVFVLPSTNEHESFGNVVIEAMACGTPTVTTEMCGVSDWLDNDFNRTVQPTPTAIQQGIEAYLEGDYFNPHQVRQFTLENFSWDSVAEQMERIYEEVRS